MWAYSSQQKVRAKGKSNLREQKKEKSVSLSLSEQKSGSELMYVSSQQRL